MRKFVLTIVSVLLFGSVFASNLQISNVAFDTTSNGASPNGGAGAYAWVTFDISWDNSWRDNENWDAAWIFVKFYDVKNCRWRHAWLDKSNAVHSITGTPNATLKVAESNISAVLGDRAVGCFVYRTNEGTGTNNWTVTLKWIYGGQYEIDAPSNAVGYLLGLKFRDIKEVKVFGYEMTYITEGAYYLGDGPMTNERSGGYANYFHQYDRTYPVYIKSNRPHYVGHRTADTVLFSNHYYDRTWNDYVGHGVYNAGVNDSYRLSADYPKGYTAFYMMKTEITQGMYCDFLNTLQHKTDGDTHDRYPNVFKKFRFNIKWDGENFGCDANENGVLNEYDYGQFVACNWMGYRDMLTFLDWCGLRPMSELEYEKAARGPLMPVRRQYAWGTTQIVASGNLQNKNQVTEYYAVGNCHYAVTTNNAVLDGPTRPGSFANIVGTRYTSGAGYYGNLDLSGNLWELVVNASMNGTYGAYNIFSQYVHGKGDLDENDYFTVATWLTMDNLYRDNVPNGDTYDRDLCFGRRGGAWNTPTTDWCGSSLHSDEETFADLFISGRTQAVPHYARKVMREFYNGSSYDEAKANGFRGVRTAPAE